MCSTAAQRIAEIGKAIDDLAGDAGQTAGDTDPIVTRLAELWALMAELDPEMARRLAGYQNLSALTDLRRRHTHTIRLTAGSGPPADRKGRPCDHCPQGRPVQRFLSGR